MSGSLLQMVSNTADQYIRPNANTTSTYSQDNEIHAFEYVQTQFDGANETRYIEIERLSDTVMPSYIIINTNIPMNLEQFITSIGNSKFNMEIGGARIFENRISLYIGLGLIRQLDSVTFSIGIPYSQYNDDLYLIALQYHRVKCYLKLDRFDFISDCSLVLEYKYLSTNTRRDIAQNSHEKYLQLFQSSYTELTQPTNSITQNLPFDLISKGLLIETDINNVSSIRLKLNGINRWDYNSTMLKLYSRQISPGIFYIPFNSKIDLFNKDITTYRSGLNFSRIDQAEFTINFSQPVTKLGVHSLYFNILRIMSGMAGLAFSAHASIEISTSNMPHAQPTLWPFSSNPITTSTIVWNRVNKILLGLKNTDCPITYNPINTGDEYCVCSTCKYNFSKTAFIDTCVYSNKYKCPICRSQWTDWTIYTNIDAPVSVDSETI